MKPPTPMQSRMLALAKQLGIEETEPKAIMLAVLDQRPNEFPGLMRKVFGTGSAE